MYPSFYFSSTNFDDPPSHPFLNFGEIFPFNIINDRVIQEKILFRKLWFEVSFCHQMKGFLLDKKLWNVLEDGIAGIYDFLSAI